MPKQWETLGGRLQWAIERQPPEGKSRGVGLLIRKLETAEAPAANYASIGSYLDDKVTPPLTFITAASEALGVREAWLAFNEGEPDEQEEVAAEVATDRLADGEQAATEAWARVRQEMADSGLSLAEQVRAESFVLFRDDDGLVWRAYVATLRRLVAASPLQRPMTETEILDLAGSLTGHLLATYASLHLHNAYPRPAGFSARRNLPVRGSWRFSAFAVGFLQTMASTAAEGSAPVPEDLNADMVAPTTEGGER